MGFFGDGKFEHKKTANSGFLLFQTMITQCYNFLYVVLARSVLVIVSLFNV